MMARSPATLLSFCLLLAACGGAGDRDSPARESAGVVARGPPQRPLQPDSAIVTATDPEAFDPGGIRQPFDSLFAAAQDVYFSGEYDSAAVLLQGIYQAARREGAVPHQARALTWVGLAHYRLADYRAAQRISEEALAFKLRHRLVDQYARSYNALGLIAWNESRFSDGERDFRRAIEMARDVGDRRMEATAQGNLGLVQTELGQFELARAGLLAQRDVSAELGETRGEGNALTNLGMLEIRLGNAESAIPLLREALALYQSIDYGTGTQAALGQLGTAYTALGDTRQAFVELDSAFAIATAQGLEQERVSILEAVADLYRGAGDFHRALALYDSARSINAELGLDLETGVDLRGEADIHVQLGDVQHARAAVQEALTIHRRAGAPMEVLLDLLMLAEIQDRLSAQGAVEANLVAARSLAAVLGARIARVEVGLTEARIADRNRRSATVLAAIEKIAPDLARGGFEAEWEARLLESRALDRLGRTREAANAGRRALATVERVRRNFGSGVLRTAFVSDKREVYAHLISVLLRLGETDEAFAVADAARGRLLLERLSAAGGSARGESGTRAAPQGRILLAEIDQLVESIDVAEQTPPGELTAEQSAELAQLYDRLARARDAYEGLLVRASETDRDRAAFIGEAPLDIAAVRAALRPGQLLIEYFVPPSGSVLLFAASRDRTHVLKSPVSARNLASRVRLARELIVRGEAGDRLDGVLASLHQALIRPLIQAGMLRDFDELMIIPHQVLAYLPFAALKDATTDRYLIQDFTLSVLPSAAALPLLSERQPDPQRPRGWSVFAPFPDRLPATRSELRAVAAEGRDVQRYVGEAATEPALRRALEESAVVHVATHGVMNAQNPMFSRLELARNGGGRSADDGRLEVHELLGLTIDAQLVFLSGCETGVGAANATAFTPGEDYTTLAQAFLHAGAGTVIATLWPVADAGAAAFAEAFYRALRSQSPVTALAEAQRKLMGHTTYGAPYYWAAYQLAGYEAPDPGARIGADIRVIQHGTIQATPAISRRRPNTVRFP